MKNNLPITNQETTFDANAQLVTATDLKGKIIYCNQEFINVSGFSESELIGSSHNIVRHPEMPAAAFEDLWSMLKQNKPWLGLVKNRCKDGSFYWVEAYVTPMLENGDVVGYESVRVKPEAESAKRAENVYSQLKKGGYRVLPALSLSLQMAALMGVLGLLFGMLAYTLSDINIILISFFSVTWALLAWGGSRLMLANVASSVVFAKQVVNSSLAQKILTGLSGDGGIIQLAFLMERAKLRTILGRIDLSIDDVTLIALETAQAAKSISLQLELQQENVSKLAAAMEEMSGSVSEVASNATSVSASAQLANDDTVLGKQAVSDATKSTELVANEVKNATKTIIQLEKDSEAIDDVLVVIRGIAEQTNLLALNAAIEAARAGEQGRGFAVVADEVRTLASRTQTSTEEIQVMIERLQENSRSAVKAMESSTDRVVQSVEKTQEVGKRFDEIFKRVNTLNQMNISIAGATEEQSLVSHEISQNVYSISNASDELTIAATTTSDASAKMAALSKDLRNVLERFKS